MGNNTKGNSEELSTSIDSISFINYTTQTLHNEINQYCDLKHLTKHIIETNTSMNKYLIKQDNKVIFAYKTLVDKDTKNIINIIDFNGLQTQSNTNTIDKSRNIILVDLLAYLSKKALLNKWNIRQLDICTDVNITNDKVIVQKQKVKGNRIDKLITKIGTKTQYIETVKLKDKKLDRTNMLVSSYLYNKTYKELSINNNTIDDNITRFEIKILPRMFKRLINLNDINEIIKKYTLITYTSKNKCNTNKMLLNTNKAVLSTLELSSSVLNIDGVEKFLMKIEKYITLQLQDEVFTNASIDDFA